MLTATSSTGCAYSAAKANGAVCVWCCLWTYWYMKLERISYQNAISRPRVKVGMRVVGKASWKDRELTLESFMLERTFQLHGSLEGLHFKISDIHYGLDIFFSISKCRTAGRHAGVDLTRSTPNRVLSVHTSVNIYRQVTLTVNSIFTQSLQFINSLYSLKC